MKLAHQFTLSNICLNISPTPSPYVRFKGIRLCISSCYIYKLNMNWSLIHSLSGPCAKFAHVYCMENPLDSVCEHPHGRPCMSRFCENTHTKRRMSPLWQSVNKTACIHKGSVITSCKCFFLSNGKCHDGSWHQQFTLSMSYISSSTSPLL